MKQLATFPRTVWRNQRSRVELPRMLTYTTTFKCNARCIMCDSWKKNSHEDLSLTELRTIFEQLPRMDVVRITGGEPFLRQDLLEIVHLVQDQLKPLMVHITTNGFLTERIVEFCEERDKKTPLFLLLSVDGMKERHDTIRGTKNAWDRVMQTIKALTPQREKMKLRIAVNQTIVDEKGTEDYKRLAEFFGPDDIQVNAVMAYEASAIYHCQNEADFAPEEKGRFRTFGEFSREHIQNFLQKVGDDLKRYPFLSRMVKRYYWKGIKDRLTSNDTAHNPKCVALNSHLRILPDGQIPVCQFNTSTVGHFRRQAFEDIWFGHGIEKHRDWVRRCPGCWAECEVIPNAIYSGDIFSCFFSKHWGKYNG